MRIRRLLFAALLIICSAQMPAGASATGNTSADGEIRLDVERTLDLWREGQFDEVYKRVTAGGSHTREYFVSHLASARRRPACCWEKLQEVRIPAKDDRRAVLHGRFGFDNGAGVEFMTREVKLEKDDGIWKMKMTDLLSMSGKGSKKRGTKKKSSYGDT